MASSSTVYPRRTPIIPLDYALLGLLARAPRSGYDLIQLMEEPIGFFWHARRSQIYPELARLERAGMVEHSVVEGQEGPDKKVYAITEVGGSALARWAAEPMAVRPDRDEFMLKVYSLWLVEPQGSRAMIEAYASQHRERLALYETIRNRMEHEPNDDLRRLDSPRFAAYATLLRGIEYERGYISWFAWMLDVIALARPDDPR